MTSSGTVSCLCGAIKVPLTTSLPGPTELCHCNPCRYTTGALFAGWCTLPQAPDSDALAQCTVYRSSKTHARYFCSTCGTKTFIHAHQRPDGSERNEWFAFGGAIDPDPSAKAENILDIETHEFLSDTGDGGMAAFMTELGGRQIPCFSEGRDSTALSPAVMTKLVEQASSQPLPSADETLHAECHCGGVSLLILPANHSDWSISQLDRFIAKDTSGTPTNKHMAFCCVCRSCRLRTGVSLTPFAYIPPMQVLNARTNKPVAQPHEVDFGAHGEKNDAMSLKTYRSAENSCFSFCEVCGASVLFSYLPRMEILNVHAGLLRAEEGSLARRWLSWQWGRTAWKDESTQRDVSDAWRATASTSV